MKMKFGGRFVKLLTGSLSKKYDSCIPLDVICAQQL